MMVAGESTTRDLVRRLSEAEATIRALLAGQIDAMVDLHSETPLLLSKAQEALRSSEEQYRQIVEATTDGIIKVDVDGLIVFVNRRFAEMLGHEPSDLVGKSVSGIMNAEAKVLAADAVLRRQAGNLTTGDTTFCHKSGTDIAVNIAASSLLDGEGRHIGNLGVVRDVTEQKKLQAQLMVSDRMASLGTLAAGVAHEINNPLTVVVATLDYLATLVNQQRVGAREPSDARLLGEMREPLDDARVAADRVRLIVRDLKIFSRAPADEPKSAVDVKAVMESSLRMAWNEIRHRARLVKHYGSVPPIEGNEARLGQVFLNLIVNATQAIPEGRAEQNEICVSTRLANGQVVIEVSDTGPGIPPEIVNRIFDAFFTTKAVGVGTGLGLAICQRIVTDMDGELTVASEVGKGTTFRVALPVARGGRPEPKGPVDETPVVGRRGRILVVDDEEALLRGVKRSLSSEHDVVTAASAAQALALCAAGQTFDVILCDLMMPDTTGMDFHHELTRIAPDQADRMVFMTGGAFTERARLFLAEPPKAQIDKPFDRANLQAIVRRLVR